MILSKATKASTYLRKRYGLPFISAIELRKLYYLKENLIKDHELNHLCTIKASINSQVEQYKQANIILTVILFIVTLIFTMSNAFINLAVRSIDMYPVNENNYLEVSSTFNKVIQSAYQSNLFTLCTISSSIVVCIILYLRRYRYIVLLNNIVNETIEEKKESDRLK